MKKGYMEYAAFSALIQVPQMTIAVVYMSIWLIYVLLWGSVNKNNQNAI